MRARVGARIVGVAVVVLAVASCGGLHRHHARSTPSINPAPVITGPPRLELAITASERPTPIPRSFFGLSTGYWTLPVDERHIALYRRVISMLHLPGDGQFVLRIGGDSSDHTFYDPRVLRLPRWAFDLTHPFVARTARIVRQLHLGVILDLNLITATPALAAAWAKEAEAVMPPRSIIGYEIGNEPDLYSRVFWLLATAADRFGAHVLPKDITPASYAQDFNTYAQVLRKVVPGAPLLAPALSNPYVDLDWIRASLAGRHPGLSVVTAHHYPYSACAFPGSRLYPTIGRILSEQATAGMARTVIPMVRLAHRLGLPARLTELNSVTCGGLRGVSNTFATALWAPDALFELIGTGLSGLNLHACVFAVNDPFTFSVRGLRARPLLYGLMLFVRTLGPGAELVRVSPPARRPCSACSRPQ